MGRLETSRIAVVIAAYNASASIERAVRSALAQPETAEVCVVDDASTDSTFAVAERLSQQDGRVAVLRQARNSGPAAARNSAIAATHAPWIAILDADDYLAPGRFAALLAHGDDADFIADAVIRAPQGAPAPAFTPRPQERQTIRFEDFVLGNLGALKGPLDLGFVKPVFRRSFLEQHALRYRSEMRLGEDYQFYAHALALGARFVMTDPAGYISVDREGSLSRQHGERDLELLRDCDAGLATIRQLSANERRAIDRHFASVDCRLQWRRLISAVKARNASAALSTFTSPHSALYLAARLTEQAWARSLGRLAGRSAR